MAKKVSKKPIEIDAEKLKSGLDSLIKERDPLHKWLPILNDIKPKMQEALNAGVSLSKIRESLANGGLKVPPDVLKRFIKD